MSENRKVNIDQLLNELRLLEERVVSVKNGDSLPFSFFSESFNTVQEISRLLHNLQFMQIEDMKTRMESLIQFVSETEKKEQERIQEQKQFQPRTREKERVSTNEQSQTRGPELIPDKKEVQDNEQFQRGEEEKEQKPENEQVQSGEPDQSTEPVQFPYIQSSAVINKFAEGIELPVYKNPNPKVSVNKRPFADSSSINNKVEDSVAFHSLNDKINYPPSVADLKRGISLNDRFLFLRELFNNSSQYMNNSMEKLNSFETYEEAEKYFLENISDDFEDATVIDFLSIIKKGFKQRDKGL